MTEFQKRHRLLPRSSVAGDRRRASIQRHFDAR